MGRKKDEPQELTEHLAELRARIVRSLVYIVVGMIATWIFFDQFYGFLIAPVVPVLDKLGTKFLMTGVTEPFLFRIQVCAVAGIALTAPLLTFEMWGFISPGLTAEEKKPIKWVAPLSVVLFFAGVTTTYMILPMTLKYLAGFVPPGATLMPSVSQTLIFIVKMFLACGLLFELPVVLLFLGKVGVVTSASLLTYWRQAIVGIAILAAVLTPSGDFFTMAVVAIPVIFLYGLSIILVRFVEAPDSKDSGVEELSEA